MLIRLRLLGFFVVCVVACDAYADNAQSLAKTTSSRQVTAVATSGAAPSSAPGTVVSESSEKPEPKVFDPIGLPKPVVTDAVPAAAPKIAPTKAGTAKPDTTKTVATTSSEADAKAASAPQQAAATPKVAAAAPRAINCEPEKKPVRPKRPVSPKPVVIKSEAVVHPVVIETVPLPEPMAIVPIIEEPPLPVPAPASEPVPASTVDVPVIESSISAIKQCVDTVNNRFQKSLLVMVFPNLSPNSANGGELYQVEQQLPQLLSQLLVSRRSTIAPIQLSEALPSASAENETQLSLLTQRLARNHRSQFILSGEIVDMSMTTPDATYNPAFYTRIMNDFFDVIETKNRFDKRDRLFSFQLHLRDGFTGQELLFKRYDTYGIWGLRGKVGFGTPIFWKSDYGQQIKGLVNLAARDLSRVINCQPFIAQIDSRPGQTQFIVQGGANNGLHNGDVLALHQLMIQGSETRYQEHDVRLVNRNVAMELREVYASHSVGVINSATYLTGQLLAVSP